MLDDCLLVTTNDELHALDPADGTELWSTDPGRGGGTPALSGATAYVAWGRESEGGFSAIDLGDGSECWRTDPVARVTSNPTLAGDTIYATVLREPAPYTGAVVAIDASDGSLRWQFQTGQMAPTPAVADGTVFVAGGNEGVVYALDAETGDKRWETATQDWMRTPPTVVDGTVYVPATFAERVYALAADDGTERWRIDASVSSSVAATAETVYVPTREGFRILDADGTHRWTEVIDGGPVGAPVVADTTLLVPGENAMCFDLTDGTPHWTHSVEPGMVAHERASGISCEPAVTDDSVFLGTAPGDLYAIGD